MMKNTPALRIIALSFFLVLLKNGLFAQDNRENASLIIKEIMDEKGIEQAQNLFEEILSDTSQYILIESELNVHGYQLLRQGKFDQALAVLKMNVQAFPDSWNVYVLSQRTGTFTG